MRHLPALALLLPSCADPAAHAIVAPATDAAEAPADAGTEAGARDPGWLAQVQARVADGRYRFSADGGAWSAVNEAQGLSARASGEGFVIAEGDASVGLALAAWGTDAVRYTPERPRWGLGACAASGATDPTGACVRRLSAAYGGIEEWWENGEVGLEQGFEVEAPAGPGDLVLDLAVSGASVVVDADRAVLHLDGGGTLRCNGLFAVDARGEVLAARMEPIDGGIRLRVDVDGAAWPVTVDPTYAAYWLTVPDSRNYLGYSVEGAGDVNGDGYDDVIIGARGSGSFFGGDAYIYFGSAGGLGSAADWENGGPGTPGGTFGSAVAGAGDLNGDGYDDVVIGDPSYTNGESSEGYVAVFFGSPTGPGTTADWTVEADQASSYLGTSVAGAGDVNGDGYDDLLVGLAYYDAGSTDEGVAWLWFGSATGPASTPDWTAEGGTPVVYFGQSVAGAGDVNGDGYDDIVIGAPYYANGEGWEGQAFVYHGSSAGPPTTADWTYDSDQMAAQLGGAVAGAGDVNGDGYADVLVGADEYDNGSSNEGYAWLFMGSAGGLASSAAWTMEGAEANALLGGALAGAGDVNGDGYDDVIVGKHTYDTYAGQFYLFTGSAAGLSARAVYNHESTFDGARLGWSVAGAGDVDGDGYADVIAGGYSWDSSNGLAMVHYGDAGGLGAVPYTWSTSAGTGLGAEVADAGDLNGDGYGDIAIHDDSSGADDYVYIYEGSASGLASTAGVTLSGSSTWRYGADISSAGDVNGDGWDDLVVSASATEDAYTYEGAAWVYYGSAVGVSSASSTELLGGQAGAYFGWSVDGAGDVNGDGYDDIIVGAPLYDGTETDEGAAFVFHGGAGGIATTAAWSMVSGQEDADLGSAVSGAGDINGDGYDDVLLGASGYDNDDSGEGAVFLVYGSASGLDSTWSWFVEGDGDYLACDLAVGAGDLNGDGYDDIARGCAAYPSYRQYRGSVDVWYGGASGPAAASDWSDMGEELGAYLGYSVAPAGDLNQDGYDDLVASASEDDLPVEDQGAVHVYFGSSAGLASSPDVTFLEYGEDAQLGYVVSGTRDVDGDGRPEVLAGAPGLDTVFLYAFLDADADGDTSWTDCDDDDAARHSGATEDCDSVDDDCDGEVDEGATGTWYADADGDGYGDPATATTACPAPAGTVADATDCDDTDPAVNPGATEACTGVDDDCDGAADEAGAAGEATWYADADGDGYGAAATSALACDAPAGFVADASDCDDGSGAVSPAATEGCNGVDDDCDGAADEAGALGEATWYADADGDGYGSASTAVVACDAPAGFVSDGADCDDGAAAVSPVGVETCDGVDEDCDGAADEGLSTTWYADVDGDGYGAAGVTTDACSAPSGYVTDATDCDDAAAGTWPGAPEVCDGVDQDCDGAADEDLATSTWYADADGDGYGAAGVTTDACSAPSGHVADALDCDDTDAAVNPGAAEAWYDGVDQDCDGNDDDQDDDGLAVGADCDDADPSVGACDTGGPDDTGDTDPADTGDTDPADTDTDPADTDTDPADTDTDTDPADTDPADTDPGDTDDTDPADTDPAPEDDTDEETDGCSGCATGRGGFGWGAAALALALGAARRRPAA